MNQNKPNKGFDSNNPYKQNRTYGQKEQSQNWSKSFHSGWITQSLLESNNENKHGVDFAKDFGEFLNHKGLTTNQIRNFFGEVRRIQQRGVEKSGKDILLLKPKLAYAVKRAEKIGATEFGKVLDIALDLVLQEKGNPQKFEYRFQNFIDMLEAILAYHKASGGK